LKPESGELLQIISQLVCFQLNMVCFVLTTLNKLSVISRPKIARANLVNY